MVSNYPILSTLIFGLGAIGAVIAPVAAVVSCNDKHEEVKFAASAQFNTTADFAAEAVKQLKDKNVENGVVFTTGDKSFSTKNGFSYTALTKNDVKDVTAFTAWITKVNGTYTSLQTGITEYRTKTTDADRAAWIKTQITAHPHFAQVFGFKATDTDTALVANATKKLAIFAKAEATFKALDKEL